MENKNIYLIGVGGQGIGLLAETLIRACSYAGYTVKGVDTHGLAQRGGTVESHLKIGKQVYSPLIASHDADIILALERTEAYRAMVQYGKKGGVCLYYDAIWQPLDVRLEKYNHIDNETIDKTGKKLGVECIKIYFDELKDSRMQNIIVLAAFANKKLIDVSKEHYDKALNDLLPQDIKKDNIDLFSKVVSLLK